MRIDRTKHRAETTAFPLCISRFIGIDETPEPIVRRFGRVVGLPQPRQQFLSIALNHGGAEIFLMPEMIVDGCAFDSELIRDVTKAQPVKSALPVTGFGNVQYLFAGIADFPSPAILSITR